MVDDQTDWLHSIDSASFESCGVPDLRAVARSHGSRVLVVAAADREQLLAQRSSALLPALHCVESSSIIDLLMILQLSHSYLFPFTFFNHNFTPPSGIMPLAHTKLHITLCSREDSDSHISLSIPLHSVIPPRTVDASPFLLSLPLCRHPIHPLAGQISFPRSPPFPACSRLALPRWSHPSAIDLHCQPIDVSSSGARHVCLSVLCIFHTLCHHFIPPFELSALCSYASSTTTVSANPFCIFYYLYL